MVLVPWLRLMSEESEVVFLLRYGALGFLLFLAACGT
ncbi:MAG: hypothetical protein ACI9OJ_005437, partial [Myxococcota bacterium]